eukprot:CAMPEP_0206582566 /NCGR_PEP_ID=MMETSP0325_2-20121206/34562_1 /ASSEMBLY_ACC=CAM_ASM_000347 /TAXON_ID=2866 /ORGANISM="Crypthecodinium cohnii, Strain Seligo" /LENGTH=66 /DNA_ID=CAMNT_0054089275 /DNA_START=182 /DNA_END=382 /DNA_ORIENTATION=-
MQGRQRLEAENRGSQMLPKEEAVQYMLSEPKCMGMGMGFGMGMGTGMGMGMGLGMARKCKSESSHY